VILRATKVHIERTLRLQCNKRREGEIVIETRERERERARERERKRERESEKVRKRSGKPIIKRDK
jgi:hypothetical protein